MTRLQPVGAKHLDPSLLLDQLVNGQADVGTENQVFQFLPGRYERHAPRLLLRQGWRRCAPGTVGSKRLLQALRDEMVLLLSLLRDQRLGGLAKRELIACASRAD